MKSITAAFALILIAAALFATGCSSARVAKSPRKGFFDRFAGGSGRPAHYDAGAGKNSEDVYDSQDPNEEEVHIVHLRKLASGWKWPLHAVSVTSRFGQRDRDFHEGVDLRARSGTPVFSADAGVVAYAGSRISGYGKMVVIKHKNGLATVYAHNSKLFVRQGQRVKQGQKIASSGNTGRSSGPHLHFEVRDGVVAVDPLRLMGAPLPTVRTAKAVSSRPHARKVAAR